MPRDLLLQPSLLLAIERLVLVFELPSLLRITASGGAHAFHLPVKILLQSPVRAGLDLADQFVKGFAEEKVVPIQTVLCIQNRIHARFEARPLFGLPFESLAVEGTLRDHADRFTLEGFRILEPYALCFGKKRNVIETAAIVRNVQFVEL